MTEPGQLSATLRTCDAVGRLMEYWGFSRHMGRVWTLLFLSETPLPASQIQEELSASAAAVSTVLKELRRWAVVKKVWVPGERKDHYEAETSLWKMVSRVFEERERNLIGDSLATLEGVSEELGAASKKGKSDSRRLAAFRKERVDELVELCRLAEGMLEMFTSTGQLDASGLDRELGE